MLVHFFIQEGIKKSLKAKSVDGGLKVKVE